MQRLFTTRSAEETRSLGKKLAAELKPGTLLCLAGDLGAGKTTLAQGLLEELGADKPYTSPTFVLMKLYDLARPTATGIARVYHCDAYRIDDPVDFERLGFAEWCADPEGLVLLEWPERVERILPKRYTRVTLRSLGEHEREIAIEEKGL